MNIFASNLKTEATDSFETRCRFARWRFLQTTATWVDWTEYPQCRRYGVSIQISSCRKARLFSFFLSRAFVGTFLTPINIRTSMLLPSLLTWQKNCVADTTFRRLKMRVIHHNSSLITWTELCNPVVNLSSRSGSTCVHTLGLSIFSTAVILCSKCFILKSWQFAHTYESCVIRTINIR